MNNRRIFSLLAAALLLAASLACNLTTAATPTPNTDVRHTSQPSPANPTDTPAPTLISAPTNTSVPNGIAVSFSGVSFTIPTSLASGAGAETIAAVDEQGGPGWDVAPAHTKFTLQGYSLQGTMLQPEIYVYPAAGYEKVSDGAAISLKRLRALTSGAGMDINNDTVPFVPFFNAAQTFEAQALPMKFQNGSGIRMVTQYDQAFIQVNNHELIYHFEGLTSDGNYYIIAILPIDSPSLAADGNPGSSVPSGGIPFNENDPKAYFAAVSQSLNNAAPGSFTPSLATLDALIQSIKVVAP